MFVDVIRLEGTFCFAMPGHLVKADKKRQKYQDKSMDKVRTNRRTQIQMSVFCIYSIISTTIIVIQSRANVQNPTQNPSFGFNMFPACFCKRDPNKTENT